MHFPHPGEKPPVGLLCVEALWLNPAELSVLHRPFIPSQPYWLGPGTERYSSCLPTHPICHKSLPPGVFGVPPIGQALLPGMLQDLVLPAAGAHPAHPWEVSAEIGRTH